MTREMGPPENPDIIEGDALAQAEGELGRLLLTIPPDLWETDEQIAAARARIAELKQAPAADAAG